MNNEAALIRNLMNIKEELKNITRELRKLSSCIEQWQINVNVNADPVQPIRSDEEA